MGVRYLKTKRTSSVGVGGGGITSFPSILVHIPSGTEGETGVLTRRGRRERVREHGDSSHFVPVLTDVAAVSAKKGVGRDQGGVKWVAKVPLGQECLGKGNRGVGGIRKRGLNW